MSRSQSPHTGLLEAFAQEHHVSTRRARDLRRSNDPRWTSFISARASRNEAAALASAAFPDPTPDPVSLASFEDTLRSCVEYHELAHGVLLKRLKDRADDGLIQSAQKMCLDATKNRMLVEQLITEHRVKTGELIPKDSVRAIMSRICDPLVAELDGLPAKMAQMINPANPLLAQTHLQNAIDEIKKTVRDSLLFIATNTTPTPIPYT